MKVDGKSLLSALMLAAKTNNPKAINLLLQRGADPDIVDENNLTALTHAIGTNSLENVKTLIKITTQQLNIILEQLAESDLDIDDDLRDCIIEKIRDDETLLLPCLTKASTFGKHDLIKLLLDNFSYDIAEETSKNLLENVIMSDDPEACKVVNDVKKPKLNSEHKALVQKRGK